MSAPPPSTATSSARSEVGIAALEAIPSSIISLLADDEPLPEKHRDHSLGGEWHDHRECHLKPDLLLIYRKPGAAVLQLVRLGSHSELFR